MDINISSSSSRFVLPSWHIHGNNPHQVSTRESVKSNRLPFLNDFPDSFRNHFVATAAEFIGTTLFLLFAFSGTEVALLASPPNESNTIGAPSDTSQLMYIALSFGMSLAVNAWVFFRISGGLFNPAVTMGMCLVGAIPYFRGLLLAISQILGGITAAAIVSALFPGPLKVRTILGGGTTIVQGLFIEMFLTALLVFTIFMLAAEKHKGTFIAPIGIGLSLFVAELTGVYFTGGSVNPTRSFGPSVVQWKFTSYHWIYWLGPVLGSLLASAFYLFIKKLEYETANPGQDDHSSPDLGEHFNPDLEKASTNPTRRESVSCNSRQGPEDESISPRSSGYPLTTVRTIDHTFIPRNLDTPNPALIHSSLSPTYKSKPASHSPTNPSPPSKIPTLRRSTRVVSREHWRTPSDGSQLTFVERGCDAMDMSTEDDGGDSIKEGSRKRRFSDFAYVCTYSPSTDKVTSVKPGSGALNRGVGEGTGEVGHVCEFSARVGVNGESVSCWERWDR